MFFRTSLVAALALACHGGTFASSVADFSKVYEGVGSPVDLNNARQVLLSNGTAGFSIFDLSSGSTTTVGLSAELQSGGYTTLSVTDLSNTGYVSGFLNDTTPFLWSSQSGFQIVPVGYGGKFVNDAGLTVGPSGVWSLQSGSVSFAIPGTVTALNNLGQVGYIGPFIPYTGNPGGTTKAGVLSSSGQSLFSQTFTAVSYLGTDQNDQFSMPDSVLLNDAGVIGLVFDPVKSWLPHTDLYTGGVSLGSTVWANSLNKAGQLVGARGGNSLTQPPGPYYGKLGESVDLSSLVGVSPLIRINDAGLILQNKGTSFALYQWAPQPALPAGTGTGLKGQYFNKGLFGSKLVLTRTENPSFDWGTARPAAAVNANLFTVNWSGTVQAEEAGSYRFQTLSDDGVRVSVNGQLIIDHWTAHSAATKTSGAIVLEAGKRYAIAIDYYDNLGAAVMQLTWQKPSASSFTAIPTNRLYLP